MLTADSSLWLVITTVAVPYVLYAILAPRHRLNNFEGPWLAHYTDLWRLYVVWRGRPFDTFIRLHRKYGAAVRIGLNFISLRDPDLIKIVFQTRPVWRKSDAYEVNDVLINGRRLSSPFGTRDEEWHSHILKPARKLYTTAATLNREQKIDNAIELLCARLEEFAEQGKSCPLDIWIEYFSWDAMGCITFGQPLGCLEEGADTGNIIETSRTALSYFSIIMQVPQLDVLLDKNPVHRVGPPALSWATNYSLARLKERLAERDGGHAQESSGDFLDDLIAAKEQAEHELGDDFILTWLMSNVVAGSDTTAIALRAVFYYTLRDSISYKRLKHELISANLSLPVHFEDIQHLVFLDAVIREAMRLHPSVGMFLERVVPAEGLELPDGRCLPPGTVVGMNPFVIHRDESVFGTEPDASKPERWLQGLGEDPAAWEERVESMKAADLSFGHGKRGCTGRSVALIEVYKAVATLFVKFDFDLLEPQTTWNLDKARFFSYQSGGLLVNVSRSKALATNDASSAPVVPLA